jgi:hypothetical protein
VGTIGGGVYALETLPACGERPQPDCKKPLAPRKASLLMVNGAQDKDDLLVWDWTTGAVTGRGEFYDPMLTTDHVLCVYDETAGEPHLALMATAPAGGTCGTQPCWHATETGFDYVDAEKASDGLRKLRLKQGLREGKAGMKVKAKGVNLTLPELPLTQSPKVVVQLRNSFGSCWGAEYGTARRNDAKRFNPKSD